MGNIQETAPTGRTDDCKTCTDKPCLSPYNEDGECWKPVISINALRSAQQIAEDTAEHVDVDDEDD